MWFKNKNGKVNDSDAVITKTQIVKNEEINIDDSETSIKYWIDICGFLASKKLLIRGWAVDDGNEISISLIAEDNIPVYLQDSIEEKRDDVLSHLNLSNKNLKPGFFNIYDCELNTGELFLKIKSKEAELVLPLNIVDQNIEQLENSYNLFEELKGMSLTDLDDGDVNEYQYSDQSNIAHYIEKVGNFNDKFVVIKGWCADIANDSKVQLSIKCGDSSLRILKIIKRERLDVAQSFELFNTEEEHGFLLIVELFAPAKQQLELKFKSSTSEKIAILDIEEKITHRDVENKLLDTQRFTLIEAKKWLIENVGASYFLEIKKEFVDTKSITTKIQVESAINCGKNGTFIRGWIDNHFDTLFAICVSNGSKISENLLPLLCRKVRPDVNEAFSHLPQNYKSGFYCYSSIKKESAELAILLFEKSGAIVRIPLSVMMINDNEIMATQHVLVDVEPRNIDASECYEHHILPALQGIWSNRIKQPDDVSIKEFNFGVTPTAPRCSVIIPLYGRYDFVLHQISQFEKDTTLQDIEFIYVLDDPRIEQPLLSLCEDIAKLYSVPFKVITCGRNLGFSGANNLGVSRANGEKLLLLNSDVIPSEHGWLTRMLDKYDNTDSIGAMGVKLVFEDETIQHIGMQFLMNREFGGIWLNEHQYKGMPVNLAPKFDFNKSNTVTAACLLIDKDKFESVGGFETRYILGDFEDSDLCLKLIEQGYDNYVLGSEKLYHLERQSQSLVDQGDWKFKLTLFNGWQHTSRWNNMINELREENV
jgi:GT2 family glycosyltransferase